MRRIKILLFGKKGQLGWELNRSLATAGDVLSYDYPEVDFSEIISLRKVILTTKPNLIINAAAYTNVDLAETEIEIAHKVNAVAPGVIGEECRKLSIPLVHYSTDYVFDGEKGSPYTEDDLPNPVNTYGTTKLEGEKAVLQSTDAFMIFRTSWVYSLRTGGFVNKVLEWSQKAEPLRIVEDQIANPTWARYLAEITAQMVAVSKAMDFEWVRQNSGLYHLAGDGYCSRFEWAKAIIEEAGRKGGQAARMIEPAKSTDFVSKAQRPLMTALDCRKLYSVIDLKLPPWRVALSDAFDN